LTEQKKGIPKEINEVLVNTNEVQCELHPKGDPPLVDT